MREVVERRPNAVQVPLVLVGSFLVLIFGRRLTSLVPPVGRFPPDVLSPLLYDWSTVQFGLALVILGLALSNRSILHRFRVAHLSRTQRIGAIVCAVALASPWITAFVAGPVFDFAGPFATLWSLAFLCGVVGFCGVWLIGVGRIGQLYLTSADRFPYVEADASRRQAMKGVGLALSSLGAVGTAFAAGRVTFGESPPAYHGRASVVYERDDLRLQPLESSVRLGETITFEITNTDAEDSVALGCHVPWALQSYEDGSWHHVTWTEGRYYLLCATSLAPGASETERVTFSEEGFTDDRTTTIDPVRDLEPGTYRLVLVGTKPYLAVNFQVLPRS